MEQRAQYVNRFNIAINSDEVVFQFIQQQPLFDANGNFENHLAQDNVANIVMPLSCAYNLLQVLTNCIAEHESKIKAETEEPSDE